MKQWEDYWFGAVSPARPYLLIKGVLFLLAFDTWAAMIEHGGRYGVGGFNVSHFAILDALQPVPTSGFYVGLIIFCGLVAFTVAFAGTNRWLLGLLAVLYAYGWMMSMLDSYQHHYLLSIVLVSLTFFPPQNASQIFGRIEDDLGSAPKKKKGKKKRRAGKKKKSKSEPEVASTKSDAPSSSAWAYYLVATSCTVVYAYTAVAKTEHDWRMGSALQNIAPAALEPFRSFFVGTVGLEEDSFWWMMGHSVILVQVMIATGYVVSPLIDRGKLWPKIVCGAAFFAAVSFHLGAEYMELQIGWFSWYMLIAACVYFLPQKAVWWTGWLLSWPARAMAGVFRELDAREAGKRRAKKGGDPGDASSVVPLVLGVALVTGLAGWAVDMPGSLVASIVAAGILVAGAMYLLSVARGRETRSWVGGLALAAFFMWVSVAISDVRWSYYRKVGGVYRRHGNGALRLGDQDRARENLSRSLEAYVKTNIYAPRGGECNTREDCGDGIRCEDGECTGDRQAREDEVRAALETLGEGG